MAHHGPMDTDYSLMCQQVRALLGDEPDLIAKAANFASFVYHEVPDLNWAGFYFPDANGDLVLGPFGGRPACTRLPKGRGVCGAAYALGTTIVVDDVSAYGDHIVCDSASASEIVVPLIAGGKKLGVFDIDSPRLARFSLADRVGLEALVGIFLETIG
ncbi:MAG: GAF domain-containing protein [Vulcanimicrobiaceae bacterium]